MLQFYLDRFQLGSESAKPLAFKPACPKVSASSTPEALP